ncbi:MAG: SNF2-related protein [Planctomycetota bacterium]
MANSRGTPFDFTPTARLRALEYVRSNLVQVDTTDPTKIVARVGPHRVFVTAPGNEIDAWCDCDSTHVACEHLAATFLFLEQELNSDPGAGDRRSWRQAFHPLDVARFHPASHRWSSFQIGQSQLCYVVATAGSDGLRCEVRLQRRRKDGAWGEGRAIRLESLDPTEFDPVEFEVLQQLRANSFEPGLFGYRRSRPMRGPAVYGLVPEAASAVLRALAGTGRLYLEDTVDHARLSWSHTPWELEIDFAPNPKTATFTVTGALRRGEERRELSQLQWRFGDCIGVENEISGLAPGIAPWIRVLESPTLRNIPVSEREAVLRQILERTHYPILRPGVGPREDVRAPRGRIVVTTPAQRSQSSNLECQLFFDYGDGILVEGDAPTALAGFPSADVVVRRDFDAERRLVEQVVTAGAQRKVRDTDLGDFTISPKQLSAAVDHLVERGWSVEAEGVRYRNAGAFRFEVSSGIDWFGVSGGVDFEGEWLPMPKLLAQLRRGKNLVELGDGSQGILPADWLESTGLVLSLGDRVEETVRFQKSQSWVLDVLLLQQPDIDIDEQLRSFRERVRSFERVTPKEAPASFCGTLRGYQRDGLAWLNFLREIGLGGCLADDMGLGKTVQLLAHLDGLRTAKSGGGPHLVVAPRSVVGNWLREAKRFAPSLRAVDYTGADRELTGGDVYVTTYGILRQDLVALRAVQFDTVILDEAQAIKNEASQTAKAARLLRGHHRLAMTGTPIENHIGELWSLFEFLNPGMLGAASRFREITASGGNGPNPPAPPPVPATSTARVLPFDRTTSAPPVANGKRSESGKPAPTHSGPPSSVPRSSSFVAQAIRPFILRRTKEQVLTELPPKLEQTIFCEMEPEQQNLYQELAEHYRQALTQKVAEVGLGKAKIHVLEALLRLRQAACHPALLNRGHEAAGSVKLDVLGDHLESIQAEGHKALVFSQFTQFLALVRTDLDRRGIDYEYLDGRTRDRDLRVDRFQSDPKCSTFLISLKAGGFGLNLTAADYVFVLDPWWNPAVEAQAIDRAHRIGQNRRVFAYRLIARGTVEEKILELQASKRELADSIIRADQGLVSQLTRDDLELLLGSG